MNNDPLKFYMTLSTGIGVLTLMVYLGGALVCAAHRRLSPMLGLAAAGFTGMFLASAVGRTASFTLRSNLDIFSLILLGSSVLGFLSSIVLVIGLGAALADIRRQLILSKGPRDDFA